MDNKNTDDQKYFDFIKDNLDFVISYDDEMGNTRLMKYNDFISYFVANEGEVLPTLTQNIVDSNFNPYFGYALFRTLYGEPNNLQDASKNGISGEVLFYNTILMCAYTYRTEKKWISFKDIESGADLAIKQSNRNARGCFLIFFIIIGIISYFIFR